MFNVFKQNVTETISCFWFWYSWRSFPVLHWQYVIESILLHIVKKNDRTLRWSRNLFKDVPSIDLMRKNVICYMAGDSGKVEKHDLLKLSQVVLLKKTSASVLDSACCIWEYLAELHHWHWTHPLSLSPLFKGQIRSASCGGTGRLCPISFWSKSS